MRIVDILSEDLVVPEVSATARDSILEEVAARLAAAYPNVDKATALSKLLAREALGSTGVGHGFAIPHARLKGLTTVVCCFARSSRGVDFGSLDGQPAHLFLTLLAPEGSSTLHLKALARAARLFNDGSFRTALHGESDRARLWALICRQDAELSKNEAAG